MHSERLNMMLGILLRMAILLAPMNAVATETLQITIWETLKGSKYSSNVQRERQGELIIHGNEQIEFQLKGMKVVHGLKLNKPKYEFDTKNGKGHVELVFDNGKLTSGMIVENHKQDRRETISHVFLIK